VQVVRKLAEADVAHDFEAMVVHPPRTRDELFVASFWIGHPLKFSWPQSVETVVHPPDKHAWHSPFGYAFAHSVVEPCVAELVSQPPQRATRTASLLARSRQWGGWNVYLKGHRLLRLELATWTAHLQLVSAAAEAMPGVVAQTAADAVARAPRVRACAAAKLSDVATRAMAFGAAKLHVAV